MLSSKYLIRILIFLFLILLISFLNFSYIKTAFFYNKELNAAIIFLFILGVIIIIRHILEIKKEYSWLMNFVSESISSSQFKPTLLKDILYEFKSNEGVLIEEKKSKIILERLITKMDFDKEVNRYLIVLLVFLGLLGTFWGLLLTIESVGKAIGELSIEEDNILFTFLNLKEALKAPLSGMGTAFSTSLFGLAASLALGFIDLQFSKVQNDFLIYVEENLNNFNKSSNFAINKEAVVSEEYLTALLSQTLEGINDLNKYLEKGENSRKAIEELISKFMGTISKINDEINIRNNQYQKVEIISVEHLRRIDDNLEVLKKQSENENSIDLEELSSQIKLLAKTISLIKSK